MLSMSPKTKAQLAHEHLERAQPAVETGQYIHRQPQLDALARYVDVAEALVDGPFLATGAHTQSRAA
jgi:hypothetical protein